MCCRNGLHWATEQTTKSDKEICCVDWPSFMGFERPLWHSLRRPHLLHTKCLHQHTLYYHLRSHTHTLHYIYHHYHRSWSNTYQHIHKVGAPSEVVCTLETHSSFVSLRSVVWTAQIYNNKNHIKLWNYNDSNNKVLLWEHRYVCRKLSRSVQLIACHMW